MKTTNPYNFILIGLVVRLLRHCSTFSVVEILGEHRKLVDHLKIAEYNVTMAGLIDLTEMIKDLNAIPDKSKPLSPADSRRLEGIMATIERLIFAESQTKRLYIISENRFNLEALLNSPHKMFDDDTYNKIPLFARNDLKSGFQCLAFDQPTACAFHILRATEAVLKEYYFALVKRNRVDTPMWGNMIDALIRKKKHDSKLIERLRYIKDSFRNPTSHPEAIYTLHEAQDLIGICIDVVNKMSKELPEMSEYVF